jgi:ATP-dependent 26S proteasome regulatory subunit
MYERKQEAYNQVIELERELMRRERQLEYLQIELRKCHNLIEELKQGMKPVGSIEEVRGDYAYVKLAGGQVYQVSIPQELKGKVTADCDAVLSPARSLVLDVIERPKERSIWEYKIERAPDVYYEDVVGLSSELTDFRKAIEWVLNQKIREKRERIIKDKRLLEEVGSVLLYGPPGTGKTYIAKAVAGTTSRLGQKTSFIKIEGYEVVSKWLGESARNIKEIFKLARKTAPAILFIDEADAIGRARMEATTDAGRDVQGMLNQILTELGEGFSSNRNVAVVFATNFPEIMDPALMDRIRKMIYIPPPRTRSDVKRLFDFYISKVEAEPRILEDGGLAEDVFEELWNTIRKRRQIYEVRIPRRGIRVRDEYSITPRDVKNIIQEAANDASFEGQKFVTREKLLEYTRKLLKGDGTLTF